MTTCSTVLRLICEMSQALRNCRSGNNTYSLQQEIRIGYFLNLLKGSFLLNDSYYPKQTLVLSLRPMTEGGSTQQVL